jgi:cell division protease FtsH
MIDKNIINEKNLKLQEVSAQLKRDFIGLDTQINQIIESLRIWYIMPDLLTRPPIINLWGMTGTGKTDLVRKLSKYLGFADKLVEIQMDSEVKTEWSLVRSVKDAMMYSDIEEGGQGILLFDEFQRFNSKDEAGMRITQDKFNDIWMLMSDGVFNSAIGGIKTELMDDLGYEEYMIKESDRKHNKTKQEKEKELHKNLGFKINKDTKKLELVDATTGEPKNDDDDDDEDRIPYGDHKIGYYKAKTIKKKLKLKTDINEVMGWTNREYVSQLKENMNNTNIYTGGDYSKVLIFVCGNLDNAYSMANDVAEADISADILHKFSLKINLVDIKKCLSKLYYPEQVARLGNNHVIYRCLNNDSYTKIIEKSLNEFKSELKASHNFDISFTDDLIHVLYDNFVYPSQGVRPVFSGISSFLSEVVPKNMFKILDNDLEYKITLGADGKKLWVINGTTDREYFSYDFALDNIKDTISDNKRIMYAVHEGAHALVYSHLFGYAPKIVTTEITSFDGAYVLSNDMISTKDTMLNKIKVALAGTVGEEIVFGDGNKSSGCSHDIRSATTYASTLVRNLSMGSRLGLIGEILNDNDNIINNTLDTNEEIEHILRDCKDFVRRYINDNRELFKSFTDELIRVKKMSGFEICEFLKDEYPDLKYIDPLDVDDDDEIVADYEGTYDQFKLKTIQTKENYE